MVGGMTMPLCDGQDWKPPQGNDLVFGAMRWGRVVDDVACLDLETLVWSRPVWKSTLASDALSHFSAMTRPSWLGRAARNRHFHAIEQASRR